MKIQINFLISLFLLFFITVHLQGQEYHATLVSSNLELKDNSTKIPDNVILKVNQDESGFTHVVVSDGVKDVAEILLKPFSYELFKAKMKGYMFPKLVIDSVVSGVFDDSDDNDQKLMNLYTTINSYFNTVNERQEVATVKLKKAHIKIYAELLFTKTNDPSKTKIFKVHIGDLERPEVFMTFYSGFIEKIEVHGGFNGNAIKLSNEYSIGVSSESNVESFNKIRLFTKYPYDMDIEKIKRAVPILNPNHQTNKDIDGNEYKVTIEPEKRTSNTKGYQLEKLKHTGKFHLYLNDLISYERYLDVNANDISPSKQRIVLDEQQESAKVYREESTKILEAVVYTDLLGALEVENPNGIIQTEINKKFNINTARGDFLGSGGGMFEYLDVGIKLSKIEEDNKYILPVASEFGLLNIFRHRNFSVGGLLNIITFENQNLKLNAFYESGFEFSRSAYKINDVTEGTNLNAIQWSHQFKVHIFPEKRYGVVLRDKLFYYEVLEKEEELLGLLNKKKDWFNTIELSAYLDIATSAKLFVRYALVHELSNIDNNFSRFQIGTAFFLLQKNRKDLKKE